MKKIMKKAVALVAVAAITATTLVGCASGSNVDNSEVVANVGDTQITAGVANFYLRHQQAGMESIYSAYFGDNFWGTEYVEGKTYESDMKEQVINSLHEFYVLEDHMAEYDVTITDEELAAIDKSADAFIAENDAKVLENISGEKEVIAEVLKLFTINEKMYKAMVADVDTKVSDEEAAQKRMRYYSVSKTDATTSEKFTDEELEALKLELGVFLKGAKDNGSMEDYAKENEINTYTLAFDKNTTSIAKEVAEAADKLKEGEFSDIIETDGLFYVVQLESEFDKEATETMKETIVSTRQSEAYAEVAEKWLEETAMEVNKDVWNEISVAALKVIVKEK